MDGATAVLTTSAPLDLRRPAARVLPLVVASPHSGSDYPEDFVAASRLDPLTLRRSEDAFVDEIFAAAPALGAPLLAARFPRAYLDVNREAYELDPAMFADALPDYVNVCSPRVRMGLGTIARVVASGEDIYDGKLSFAEAEERVETLYRPYHAALARLIEETSGAFGCCLVIDCHSMPSGASGAAVATRPTSSSVTATAPPARRRSSRRRAATWLAAALPWRSTRPMPAASPPGITAARGSAGTRFKSK